MRSVVFEIAVSLDGFIKGSEGGLDWFMLEEDGDYANTFLSRFDTIFYGRVAYEKFGVPREIDPLVSEAAYEFYSVIKNMRKYVFSRTQKHVAGNGMVISDNLFAEVQRIKDEDGKDIWLCGGADILHTFIQFDLIDEYILAVQPQVLGTGKPLFNNPAHRLKLRLVKTQNLKSGVVMLHYKPENRITLIHKEYDRSF